MELFFQNFVPLKDLVKRDWSNLKLVIFFFIKQVVFEVALNQRFSRLWWTVHQKWIAYGLAVRFVTTHCVKSVQIHNFLWSVFSRIRTAYREIWSIQSECGKIRTRKKLRIWTLFSQWQMSNIHLFRTLWWRGCSRMS